MACPNMLNSLIQDAVHERGLARPHASRNDCNDSDGDAARSGLSENFGDFVGRRARRENVVDDEDSFAGEFVVSPDRIRLFEIRQPFASGKAGLVDSPPWLTNGSIFAWYSQVFCENFGHR